MQGERATAGGEKDAGQLLELLCELSGQYSSAKTSTDADAEEATETPTCRETDSEQQSDTEEAGGAHTPDASGGEVCPLCDRPCERHHRLGRFWRKFGYAGPPYCTRCSSVFRAHLVTRLVDPGGRGCEEGGTAYDGALIGA